VSDQRHARAGVRRRAPGRADHLEDLLKLGHVDEDLFDDGLQLRLDLLECAVRRQVLHQVAQQRVHLQVLPQADKRRRRRSEAGAFT